MPGIFGVVESSSHSDPRSRLRPMAARMRHHSWYEEEIHVDRSAGMGMGRLRLERQDANVQKTRSADEPMLVVVDGEIYDADEHRLTLRRAGHEVQDDSTAELIAVGVRAQGAAFLRGLHGKFVAAIWDRCQGRLTLVNDRFGMRPLYYAQIGTWFLFASEIKALLVNAEVPRQSNLKGIAQFFTFGHLLGEDTLVEGIYALPAAGILQFRQGRLELDRYWQPAVQPERRAESANNLMDRIDQAFGQAVRRCTTGNHRLGLSLSGGLDSRTILGVLDDEQPVTTISLGMAGSADHRSAAELARLTHRPHHQCLLGVDFLERFEDHFRQMVRLTDGHYLSQCIVMPTLPVYRNLGIQVLLRGHAGELMHMRKAYNFSLDARAMALKDEASLEDWLFGRLQAYILAGTEGRLFANQHRKHIEELAREALRASLRESEGMQPLVHRIWHMFLTQRLRRETAMSLVKFGSLVETRLPYVDNDLVDALFAAPPEMKLGEALQFHILRQHRPSFLKVLNVNTGAPMGVGPFGQFLGKVRQKVFAKLGVAGYQPYERLGLWLRRELRPMVQKLLLSDDSLDRGIFDANTIRQVVEDHFQGKNHTFLLMALMTYELGQRELASTNNCNVSPTSEAPAPCSAPTATSPS
jgi:asparagine synthase (glutamine-hydrolysing)